INWKGIAAMKKLL
uniref:Mastoparan-like peptide 12b n=1 Tax=Vespa magnifica TaxID=202807 RepID=MASTB_VESMG|nr:RecName: Full=Mastoparan-like peptide 12b [Vespa magnifica]